ncbi:MAG TPA: four helix bundle protein [Acidobacteriota bacterium]
MKDLKDRTKRFALEVIRFCSRMPNRREYWVIGKQLIECASSVGANYRSACRGKSRADFIAKLSFDIRNSTFEILRLFRRAGGDGILGVIKLYQLPCQVRTGSKVGQEPILSD